MDITHSSPLDVEHQAWNSMEVLLSATTGQQRRTLTQEMKTLYHSVQTAIWPLQTAETNPPSSPSTGILSCFKLASQQITSLKNQSPCRRSSIPNSQGTRQDSLTLNKSPHRIPRNERVTLPPVRPKLPASSPVLPPTTTMPESGSSLSQSWSPTTPSSVISSQPASPSKPSLGLSSQPASPSTPVPSLLSVRRSSSLHSSHVPSSMTTPSSRQVVQDVSSPSMPVLTPVLPVEPMEHSSPRSMPVLTPKPGLSCQRHSLSDELVCQPFLCTKKLTFSPVSKASSKQKPKSDSDVNRRWSSVYPVSPQKPKQQQKKEHQHQKQKQIPKQQQTLQQQQIPQQIKKKPQQTHFRDIGMTYINDIFGSGMVRSACKHYTAITRDTTSQKPKDSDKAALASFDDRDVVIPVSEPSILSLHATTQEVENHPRSSSPSDCAKRKLVYNNNKLVPLKKRFNPNFKIQSKKADSRPPAQDSKKPQLSSSTRSTQGSKGEKKQRNKSGKISYKGAQFEIGGTNRTSRARDPIESPNTEKETITHLKQILTSFMSTKKTSTSVIIHSSKQTRLIEFAGLCYISAVRITGGVRLRKNSFSRAPIAMDVEWLTS